jgi:hypothetical protein
MAERMVAFQEGLSSMELVSAISGVIRKLWVWMLIRHNQPTLFVSNEPHRSF